MFPGVGYDRFLGVTGSVSFIVGEAVDGSRYLPAVGARGLLAQGSLGTRGAKLGLGWARASLLFVDPEGRRRFRSAASPASLGIAAKASVLKCWDGPVGDQGTTLGAEVDVAFLARFSVGVSKGFGSDRSLQATWGISLGF